MSLDTTMLIVRITVSKCFTYAYKVFTIMIILIEVPFYDINRNIYDTVPVHVPVHVRLASLEAAEDLELLEGDKFDPLFDQLRIVPKKKLKMWLNSK